jgi:ATPase subunit of ABC transporter with duplicated ATPase domains
MCVDQSRDSLDESKSVYETLSVNGDEVVIGGRAIPARAYASWFNFKGGDQQKRVGDLSGGERNRLHLASTLLTGGNTLLLDEPSNDLDLDTLRCLEDAINSFAGTTLVISHDRFFLDRLATHILAFEGDSNVVWFEGSWSEYDADRKRRTGINEPTRLKYRPMPALA